MTDLGCLLSNVGDGVALWLCCSPTTRMPEPYPEPYSHAVPFGKGGDPPKKLLHHQYGGVTEKGKPNHYAWIVDNESVDASVCRRRKLKPKVAYTGDNPTNVREAPTQIPHTRPGYQPLHTHTCTHNPPLLFAYWGRSMCWTQNQTDVACLQASPTRLAVSRPNLFETSWHRTSKTILRCTGSSVRHSGAGLRVLSCL